MASEITWDSFSQQTLAFCNHIQKDLNCLVQIAEDAYFSIDRSVKVAPAVHRKSRVVDTDSCTLDLKQFTRSKQNAFDTVKATFEDMESKWSNDIAEMKNNFLQYLENSLAKIEVQISVSAEDLNNSKSVNEMNVSDESSSSYEEMEQPSNQQHSDNFRSAKSGISDARSGRYKKFGSTMDANIFSSATVNKNRRRTIGFVQNPQNGGRSQKTNVYASCSQTNSDEEDDLTASNQYNVPSFSANSKNPKRKSVGRVLTRKSVGATKGTKEFDDEHIDEYRTAELDYANPNQHDSTACKPNPTINMRKRGLKNDAPSTPVTQINRRGKKETAAKPQSGKSTKSTKSNQEADDKGNATLAPILKNSGGKMTDWQGLAGAAESAPCKPAVFELKVWRAKKPAYIGHTDNLRDCLMQYLEGKTTGEKHLDQFILRNKEEVSVRYEQYGTAQLAKLEQKKQLKEFLEKNKNLPSYNYGV